MFPSEISGQTDMAICFEGLNNTSGSHTVIESQGYFICLSKRGGKNGIASNLGTL